MTYPRSMELKTGTTTVGITTKDSVVLASDSRATMGYFIANKTAKKIFKIDDHIGATIAGSVADAQTIMDILKAETKLYKLKNGKPMKIKSVARLLSNILFNARVNPYMLQTIVGGIDDTGPHVYSLDPLGSVMPETFVSTGSGSPVAYGVLESEYREDLTIDEAVEIAVKAVHSALERDVATGNTIHAVIITKDGYQEIPKEKIEKIRQK